MARTVLLASSSLALVVVCFAIYHFTAGGADEQKDLSIEAIANAHRDFLDAAPTTQETPQPFSIRGIEISPGEKPWVTVYDPSSGQAKVRWRAELWEPRGENVMHMVTPEVHFLMTRGRKAIIEADEAQIVMQRGDRSNFNPKRGWLKGNILIQIDRTNQKWRDEHPERSKPEQHPEYVVRIFLEDLNFDLELALLRSKGPVRVESHEAIVEGKGLVLRWNEVDNRIEQLDIAEGKRMELHRGAGVVQFAMPGSETEVVVPETEIKPSQHAMAGAAVAPGPATQPATRPAPLADTQPSNANRPVVIADANPQTPETAPAASQPGTKMQPTIVLGEERSRKKKQTETYLAEFFDEICVEQKQGVRVVGRLLANHLRLLRDFGSGEEDQLTDTFESGQDAPNDQTTEEKPKQEPDNLNTTRLVLTWSGPFKLRPLKRQQDQLPEKRFQVIATGTPVWVEDRQGFATCSQLEYHHETERVWLRGDDNNPVDLLADKNQQLHAEKVAFFDRKTGVARLEGAGFLRDTRGRLAEPERRANTIAKPTIADVVDESEPVEIQWTSQIDLTFGQEFTTVGSTKTGTVETKRRTYLNSATLLGNVKMTEGKQVLAGQRVEIAFGKPRKSTGFADNIKTMEIYDDVSLTRDDEHISCQKLLVEMAVDSAGKNVPKLAKAYGHVLARQGNRKIEAGDRMIAEFGSFKKPPTKPARTITLAEARAVAQSRGLNPTDEQLEQYLKKRVDRKRKEDANRMVVRATAMQCFGGVTVADPDEGLDVRCRELDCTLKQGQAIDRALIVGAPSEWAFVKADDFVIEGAKVDIDVEKQLTDVRGPGRLRFWARQDLDGSQRDDPVAVVVNWSKEMTGRGKDNYCRFVGDVEAQSESNTLRARTVRIDFFDVPKQTDNSPEGKRAVFASLLRSPRTERSADRMRLSKKPRFLTAEENAQVVSSTFDKDEEPSLPARLGNEGKRLVQTLVTRITRKERQLGTPVVPDAASHGRLLSRMRIAGPTLLVDFRKKAINVDGRGNLLIEDYRLASPKERQRKQTSSNSSDFVIGSLSGQPSQTLITWLNSMSFFSEGNVAVFDRGVHMVHRAGTEMALGETLVKAFRVDVQALRRMKGRRASLTCDNLLVEFLQPKKKQDKDPLRDQVAATELNQFRASGSCHLQEGTKSVHGQQVVYRRNANIVTVEGSKEIEARIFNQDERKGIYDGYRGSRLRWYRDVDRIEVFGGTIVSKGR